MCSVGTLKASTSVTFPLELEGTLEEGFCSISLCLLVKLRGAVLIYRWELGVISC